MGMIRTLKKKWEEKERAKWEKYINNCNPDVDDLLNDPEVQDLLKGPMSIWEILGIIFLNDSAKCIYIFLAAWFVATIMVSAPFWVALILWLVGWWIYWITK
jgi:hypothetical protein